MDKPRAAYEGYVRFAGIVYASWDKLPEAERDAWRAAVLSADGHEAAIMAVSHEQALERLKRK